ncbi:hypothetical protein FC83_GL001164 [Agrilactobacillus composti DSM 18527 = JCM 14202]|uniref:Uncharacterized protein n=1 Tax=Agrilactobacillus composti DSM 18527 = JCM 14202 TaxID=1423734 RepID=A0A0R1XLN9_9LACO|nr:hypothetical protein FC83_GL001164 [Agrilactobacillus composti DSM 18527 = JCM 14202]
MALIIPLIILIVVAIVFGFMALLFTILRFVLPLIIIVAVIWAILNHTNRRPPSGPRRPNPTRPRPRKDITDSTTHKDNDNWNDF